jgi:hypothetical protein
LTRCELRACYRLVKLMLKRGVKLGMAASGGGGGWRRLQQPLYPSGVPNPVQAKSQFMIRCCLHTTRTVLVTFVS